MKTKENWNKLIIEFFNSKKDWTIKNIFIEVVGWAEQQTQNKEVLKEYKNLNKKMNIKEFKEFMINKFWNGKSEVYKASTMGVIAKLILKNK